METDLIVVRQLPIIEEQLRTVQENIVSYVADILAMECNEETYKAVKKARSELNAKFNELEKRRKEVKRQIEEPYFRFDAVYKNCVGDIFSQADRELASKIASVENGLKQQKRDAIEAYFCEYRDSLCISSELVEFRHAGINITMSASTKSLKTKAKAFLDKIKEDLAMIESHEHKHEVLAEYRKTFNASQAVTIVNNRHAEIESNKVLLQQWNDSENERNGIEHAVEHVIESEREYGAAISAPIVVDEASEANAQVTCEAFGEPERIAKVCFRVTASIPKLKELKKFLIEGGYDYVNINDPGIE